MIRCAWIASWSLPTLRYKYQTWMTMTLCSLNFTRFILGITILSANVVAVLLEQFDTLVFRLKFSTSDLASDDTHWQHRYGPQNRNANHFYYSRDFRYLPTAHRHLYQRPVRQNRGMRGILSNSPGGLYPRGQTQSFFAKQCGQRFESSMS
jgi:hypothetical protein